MRFYVYEFCDPDGHVFYVGKGTSNGKGSRERFYRHRHEHAFDPKLSHLKLYRKIHKLWRAGLDFTERVVFRTDSEKEAFAEEKRRIALYGRRRLCNLTDGGDGSSGYQHTPEARRKMSAKLRGRKLSTQHRATLRHVHAGKVYGVRHRGDKHWSKQQPERIRRGGDSSQAQVTWEIVEAIRREYVPRKTPLRIFVERYGLKKSAVHKIIKYQSWKV